MKGGGEGRGKGGRRKRCCIWVGSLEREGGKESHRLSAGMVGSPAQQAGSTCCHTCHCPGVPHVLAEVLLLVPLSPDTCHTEAMSPHVAVSKKMPRGHC